MQCHHALLYMYAMQIGVIMQTEDDTTTDDLGLETEVSALKTTVQQLTEEIKELKSRLKSHDQQFHGCTYDLIFDHVSTASYDTYSVQIR